MAYVELKMWDVLEVLKLIYAGKSVRQTSKITGRDRAAKQHNRHQNQHNAPWGK